MDCCRTIGVHASPSFVYLSIRATSAERSPRHRHRKRCPSAATRGLPAKTSATSSDDFRSRVLGHSPPLVVRLAPAVALRPGRHRRPLAARTVSQILGAAIETSWPPARPARYRRRDSPVDRADGCCQSPVACTADSWRTEDARYRDLRTHRLANSARQFPGLPLRPGRPSFTTTSANWCRLISFRCRR